MKQRGVFLIGVFLMAIYYFLFPRGSGRELVLRPVSYTNIDSLKPTSSSSSGNLISVHTGDRAVYFDEEFNPVSLFESPELAVDSQWLVLSDAEGLAIREPDGRLRARLPNSAAPVTRNGKLFLYDDGIGRLFHIDPSNGALIWSRDFIAPVTVIDSAGERTLVGLLDGRAMVIDDSGETLLRYRPGGSRVEAIYGGTLSRDGQSIALVSGLDPQRYILLEEWKNGFRPVDHHETQSDFRRYIPVGFVSRGERVLYETEGKVTAVNTRDYGVTSLQLKGRPTAWNDDPETGSLALLSREKNGDSNLRVLSRHDMTFFESPVDSDTTGVLVENGHLMLLGADYFGVFSLEVR